MLWVTPQTPQQARLGQVKAGAQHGIGISHTNMTGTQVPELCPAVSQKQTQASSPGPSTWHVGTAACVLTTVSNARLSPAFSWLLVTLWMPKIKELSPLSPALLCPWLTCRSPGYWPAVVHSSLSCGTPPGSGCYHMHSGDVLRGASRQSASESPRDSARHRPMQPHVCAHRGGLQWGSALPGSGWPSAPLLWRGPHSSHPTQGSLSHTARNQ